jgi:hypothetical protein
MVLVACLGTSHVPRAKDHQNMTSSHDIDHSPSLDSDLFLVTVGHQRSRKDPSGTGHHLWVNRHSPSFDFGQSIVIEILSPILGYMSATEGIRELTQLHPLGRWFGGDFDHSGSLYNQDRT